MDIGTVIKKPFSDLKTMAIGSLAFIIPGVALGYGLKCAKDDSETLPDLSDFGEIFVQGLLATVISMIWALPAMIVGGITIGGAIIAMMGAAAKGSAGGMMGVLGGMGVGMLLFVALILLTNYLVPLAVLNFGKHGFGGGFAFGSIFKIAFTGQYFMAFLIATAIDTGIMIAAWFVSMILTLTIILSPIGFLVMLVAMFSMIVITFTMLGEVYEKLAD